MAQQPARRPRTRPVQTLDTAVETLATGSYGRVAARSRGELVESAFGQTVNARFGQAGSAAARLPAASCGSPMSRALASGNARSHITARARDEGGQLRDAD